MDIKQAALEMYPFWILGALVIFATYKSKNKDLLKINKQSIFTFLRFLAFITVYRLIIFKLFPNIGAFKNASTAINSIPIAMTLFTPWEDACHGMMLALLGRFLGDRKLFKPIYYVAMILLMMEFSVGHLYQGVIQAAMLSLYVPYSVKLGKKHGFGTVMICHILFDFVTILTIRLIAAI